MSSEPAPSTAACCSSCPRPPAPARRRWSSGWCETNPDLRTVAVLHVPARRGPGEIDGVDYNFVSRERSRTWSGGDAFLEWADIFGNLYGTGPARTPSRAGGGHRSRPRHRRPGRAAGAGAGARRRRHLRAAAVVRALERPAARTQQGSRGGHSRRLATARREIGAVDEYDYVVVNDELDRCVDRASTRSSAPSARALTRRRAAIEPILQTFDDVA